MYSPLGAPGSCQLDRRHLVAAETRQADEGSGEPTQTNAFTVHSSVIVILMSSVVVYHEKVFSIIHECRLDCRQD